MGSTAVPGPVNASRPAGAGSMPMPGVAEVVEVGGVVVVASLEDRVPVVTGPAVSEVDVVVAVLGGDSEVVGVTVVVGVGEDDDGTLVGTGTVDDGDEVGSGADVDDDTVETDVEVAVTVVGVDVEVDGSSSG